MAITRRTLIERIDRFIRSIENRKGEPDQWEGHFLKAGTGQCSRWPRRAGRSANDPDEEAIRLARFFGAPSRRNPTTAELRAEIERIKSQAR